jgi:hypothetical protein
LRNPSLLVLPESMKRWVPQAPPILRIFQDPFKNLRHCIYAVMYLGNCIPSGLGGYQKISSIYGNNLPGNISKFRLGVKKGLPAGGRRSGFSVKKPSGIQFAFSRLSLVKMKKRHFVSLHLSELPVKRGDSNGAGCSTN